MRSVGGVSRGSFQLLTRRGQRGFGAFSLHTVLFRVHGKFLDRYRETGRDNVADDKANEQKQHTRDDDLPTQPMLPRDRIGERINANFVSGRKERLRIEPFIKQEMRRVVHAHNKIALRTIESRDRLRYFGSESCLRGFRKRWQVKPASHPDPTFHPLIAPLTRKLERFESDNERGNDFTGLCRKNRHRHYLINSFICGRNTLREITGLLDVRQFSQCQLRFRLLA